MWIDASIKNETETVRKAHLRKIIELCRENNKEIALEALPFAPKEQEQLDLN